MKALCNKTAKHGENWQRKDKTGLSAKIKAQRVAQLGIPEKWQHSICKGQTVLVGTVEQISPGKTDLHRSSCSLYMLKETQNLDLGSEKEA